MRILLILLIALVAAPAWAEWLRLTEDDGITYYIDPTTARKDGTFRRIWEMKDLKKRSRGMKSVRYLAEYDCKEERVRILAVSGHSEPMAGGKEITSSHDVQEWEYIPPSTITGVIFKHLCNVDAR